MTCRASQLQPYKATVQATMSARRIRRPGPLINTGLASWQYNLYERVLRFKRNKSVEILLNLVQTVLNQMQANPFSALLQALVKFSGGSLAVRYWPAR